VRRKRAGSFDDIRDLAGAIACCEAPSAFEGPFELRQGGVFDPSLHNPRGMANGYFIKADDLRAALV